MDAQAQVGTAETAERIMALFQGKAIGVTLEDGNSSEVHVGQFRIRDYEAAFARIDDEFALVDLACKQADGWSKGLTPESFEAVYVMLQEVNAKGFFAWSARKRTRTKEMMLQMAAIPEVGKVILEAATSAVGSSRPPLRPGPTRPAR